MDIKEEDIIKDLIFKGVGNEDFEIYYLENNSLGKLDDIIDNKSEKVVLVSSVPKELIYKPNYFEFPKAHEFVNSLLTKQAEGYNLTHIFLGDLVNEPNLTNYSNNFWKNLAYEIERPKFENPALLKTLNMIITDDELESFYETHIKKEKEDDPFKPIIIKHLRPHIRSFMREYGMDKEEAFNILRDYYEAEKRGERFIFNPKDLNQNKKTKYYDAVFCDIEGTLIKDGEFNKELFEELKNYAKEKPVNIWTGGGLYFMLKPGNYFRRNFDKEGMFFPLLEKRLFKGNKVEIAIDDLPKDLFEREYGIKVNKYIRV